MSHEDIFQRIDRMRLKSEVSRSKHKDFATCVSWINNEEVISLSDDHSLMIWNATSGDVVKRIELSAAFYPTDLHAYTRTTSINSTTAGSGGSKNSIDVFVVSSTDGMIHVMNRSGRFEKSVEAHVGAALTVRWSPDGSAIASGGEDGIVKIWSKNLMLRSTFSSQDSGIHSLCWSLQSDELAFASGTRIELKALQPNSKPVTWKAHDAVILSLSWNHSNNKLLSASEDRKYKIWDSFGRILFVSTLSDHPITSASWSMDGSLMAIGSFDSLQLCSITGHVHSIEKPRVNSIYQIAWSADSSSLAAAASSGHLIFSHVIDLRLEWKSFEIVMKERRLLEVVNVIENSAIDLEFKENVIKMSIAFNQIVVITTSLGAVYKTSKLMNQHPFPLKENVSMILQCDKSFLLISSSSVLLFSYEGKQLLNIKWPGMRPESLNESNISLSCDTIAVRDDGDNKVILMIDSSNGKLMNANSIRHTIDVVCIRVNICGSSAERKCAFVDKNWDLYLCLIRASPLMLIRTIKVSAMIKTIRWNEDNDMLSAVAESSDKILVFTYPHVVFCDREMLSDTIVAKDVVPGRCESISNFTESVVRVSRTDGSMIAVGISPLLHLLHHYVWSKKWNEGLRLCRSTDRLDEHDRDSRVMWCSFAGMCLTNRQLDVCESAYSEMDRIDKVNYIQRIRQGIAASDAATAAAANNGEICLLMGSVREAEMLFLQSGLNLRAIILNLDLFHWNRALDISLKVEQQKDGLYVKFVLTHRKNFLTRFNRIEDNKSFIKVADDYEILDNEVMEGLRTKNLYEKTRLISSASLLQQQNPSSSSSATRISSSASNSSSSASSGRAVKT